MRKFKYKYYWLPSCGTAFADIGSCIGFKNAENIIVREKIDLDRSIFSNNGKGEYTFVEFAGHGINETIDGVNLYGNGSLYIKREDLIPTPIFGKPEKEFQKQIEEYVQSKKSLNERKEIKLSLQEKLDIAIKGLQWIEEQADTSTQDDYDPEVILKNIVRDCEETIEKIKEIK